MLRHWSEKYLKINSLKKKIS